MNTRHSHNDDPSHAPERNLSSARLRPINISLSIAAQSARVYPKRTREAVIWLANLAANSQRIQLCWQRRLLPDPIGTIGRITEAELCGKLGLDPIEVYRALTGHDDADLPKFVEAVEAYRKSFEAALPPLVKTSDSRAIADAFAIAGDEHRITIVQGKWRHGKTEEAERHWLLNLHRAIWIDCPEDNFERTFYNELGAVLGIGAGNSKRTPVLRQQIKSALGIGLIDTIIVDEAHNLWPENLQSIKPKRVEFIRHLRDSQGVGAVLLTTEQFALAVELSKRHNARYAPGQLAGRRYQFDLRDAHSDKEIRAIAALHCANATDEALDGLVTFAKAEEGYLGQMVEAIACARRLAGQGNGQRPLITAGHVAIATKQQQTNARIKQVAATSTLARRGRVKMLTA